MIKDLTGKRFGKLVAIELTDKREPANGCAFWKCLCDCGNVHHANSSNLHMGTVKSCGCMQRGRKKVRR